MMIALAAVGFKNGDTAYNKEKIISVIREHRYHSDLILFGETFLQGFDSLSWNYDSDKSIAVTRNDPVIDEIREAAKECSVAVSFGYIEKEGDGFHLFSFEDKKFAVGLCGDLWDDGNVEQMKTLNADIVLWPVYTDFNYEEWNTTIKNEYAEQAARFAHGVCYVNSVCMDREGVEIAKGGAAYFLDGRIKYQTPAGEESILYVLIS